MNCPYSYFFTSQKFYNPIFRTAWHEWYDSHSRQMASPWLLDPRVCCCDVPCSTSQTLSGGRRLETRRLAISCEAFCFADWNNDLAVSAFFRIISFPRNVPHIAYWCCRIDVKSVQHSSLRVPRITPCMLAAFRCTRLEMCNEVYSNVQS
jgi:hypothetical protein